ncbi:MAG: twin-arginine translocase TatA/TatE family subunit [Nitrospirota bacterium]
MFGLGTQELMIILVIIVILFGATRLPQIGSGIGQAIKNFKRGMSEPEEIDVTPKKESKKEKIEKKENTEKEGE